MRNSSLKVDVSTVLFEFITIFVLLFWLYLKPKNKLDLEMNGCMISFFDKCIKRSLLKLLCNIGIISEPSRGHVAPPVGYLVS